MESDDSLEPIPGFEEFPMPWGSKAAGDNQGRLISEEYGVVQWFVDASGSDVRDANGDRIHFNSTQDGFVSVEERILRARRH